MHGEGLVGARGGRRGEGVGTSREAGSCCLLLYYLLVTAYLWASVSPSGN